MLKCATPLFSKYNFMPILNSLSVLGAHFSAPAPAGNWYDDASDAHHAVTLNGSVTQSDEGGGVVAATINPSSRMILADNTGFDFGDGDFTIEMFIKLSVELTGTILEFDFNNRRISIDSNVLDYYGGGGFGSNYFNGFGNKSNFVNVWSHIAVVRNNGPTSLFANGIAVSSDSNDLNYTSAGRLSIGSRADSFDNTLTAPISVAGLRVNNTALYTSNFSVPTTLPTAVTGTQLLLNFGATAVPSV